MGPATPIDITPERARRTLAPRLSRTRIVGLLAVAVGIGLGLTATQARAACDLSRPDTRLSGDPEAWLAGAPAKLSRALERKGFALEDPTPHGNCPGLVPAIVVFEHPPDTVFSLLIQTERHAEFMKSLDAASPVSRAPDAHVDRQEIRILFTRISYHLRHQWDSGSRRIWWDLSPDHPNDLRAIGGYWELHPLGEGRSLGLYGTYVDVGPVIPRRLQASLTRKNLRAAVENIRTWVNAQGRKNR